jgi:2-phosphoglycerate kinase
MPKFRWRRQLPRGFVVVINGGSGVGKTTVAAALARRWKIASVIGTDVVREAFRQLPDYPPDPEIRALIGLSSFLAHGQPKCEATPEFKTACIAAFERQNDFLFGPISRIIRRLRNKREAVLLEGVNVTATQVLSTFPNPRHDKLLFANIYLSDDDTHAQRIRRRADATNEEPARTDTYLANLSAVRYIDEHLRADAEACAETGAVVSIDNDRNITSAIAEIEDHLKLKL